MNRELNKLYRVLYGFGNGVTMKYTKYNIKGRYSRQQNKNNKDSTYMGAVILLVFVGAFLVGTIFFKFVLKDSSFMSVFKTKPAGTYNVINEEKSQETEMGDLKGIDEKKLQEEAQELKEEKVEGEAGENEAVFLENKEYAFYTVQCGAFKKKENASELYEQLKDYGNPFIVEENGYNKVVLGIYDNEKSEGLVEKLKSKGIETSRAVYIIKGEHLSNKELGELITANIKVMWNIDKTTTMNTSELKKWSGELMDVDSGEENVEALNQVKMFTASLDDKIDKEDAENTYKYLYKIIKEVSE